MLAGLAVHKKYTPGKNFEIFQPTFLSKVYVFPVFPVQNETTVLFPAFIAFPARVATLRKYMTVESEISGLCSSPILSFPSRNVLIFDLIT